MYFRIVVLVLGAILAGCQAAASRMPEPPKLQAPLFNDLGDCSVKITIAAPWSRASSTRV